MNWDELPALFPAFEQPQRWLPMLQLHSELLEAAAEHTRVTAVPAEEAVQRHYAESLEIWRLLIESGPLEPSLVVDVGSGGGFPGLVAACVSRETRFALVEPLKKRARLLVEIAQALNLPNVEVHALRAEEAGRGPLREAADIVTGRAVAPLTELLEYTVPLARSGGLIGLPKGSGLAEELARAGKAAHLLGCDYLETCPMRTEISQTLTLAMFLKSRPTPKPYPRKPGMPRQKPIA